jgi:iron complex outermembrane receptor protein
LFPLRIKILEITTMPNRLPYRVTALFAAVSLAMPLLAAAADAPSGADAPAAETKSLDTIIVTGTRSTTRTEAESLSPIDVLTPADLAASGSTDLASALSNLLPSLDFPRPAINDGNDALRPATLRGLSPDQVLVLVDGKRFHTSALVNYNYSIGRGSAPVDLNAIPISAIDHIEVLRDGASAQYGSDAIAGVINIVLKHGAKEGSNDVTLNGGGMSKGDGAQNGVAGSFGMPFGTADSDGKSPGWARLSLNYQNVSNTNRASNTDRSTTIPSNFPESGPGYERYGDPAVVTYQALLNFGYTFSPAVEAYGYLDASRRDVTSNGFFRYFNSPRNVPEIYPNGFLPQIVNHTNDLNGVFGLKGVTDSGWHWDASADYGKNHLVFDIQDSVNTNLFYSTGASPTYFYAGTFSNEQEVLNLDLSKDFNVGFLPNAVTFAWGLEYRNEKYSISPGEPASYYFNPNTLIPGSVTTDNPLGTPYAGGSQVFPGLSPAVAGDWSRHSEAAYVDFETNLTDRLSAGFAARYEDYSDAGSTRSGKLSALFKVTDSFALRGTISNGFRAPSLAQQNYESITTLIQNGKLAQIGTYRTSDPVAIALGAKPLEPEKSTNYTFGATWTGFENFTSSLDIYQIRIGNEILYTDQICVNSGNCAVVVTAGSQVQGAQFFVNGATTRTRGADWTNSYNIDLNAYGELKLLLSANYNKTSILSVNAPDYIAADGTPTTTFGRASQGLLTYGTPRTKYILGGDWAYKGFNLHVNETRYGAVTRLVGDSDLLPDTTIDHTNPAAADQKFAARWLLDIAASYNWNAWTFTIGADNVTNIYPTKVNELVSNRFGYEDIYDGLQYSALSPFGFNGRYVYGKINFKF